MSGRSRALLVAALAVVLLSAGGTAAYAAWSRSVSLAPGAVTAGDFGITPTLALNLAGMYPGETRTAVMTVARTAGGQGQWFYTIGTPTVSGPLGPYLSIQVHPAAACTGAASTLPWTVATVQPFAAAPQHCVSATLSTTTPVTLQTVTATVRVPVTAENRPTY